MMEKKKMKKLQPCNQIGIHQMMTLGSGIVSGHYYIITTNLEFPSSTLMMPLDILYSTPCRNAR